MNTVTITIPCRNEAKYIGRCLQSIVNSTFEKSRLHVYVCDGLSNDGTPEIIRDFEAKFPYIHLIENSQQTAPFALNIGLKARDADMKIILGAHAEIYPDYIQQCINAFTFDQELGCVGGIIENVYENATAEVIGMAMSSGFGVGNAHFRTGESDGYVDTVAFGAYKKEVFEKIGFFDEELIRNQDDEFNFRLLKHGFKIYLFRKIKSKYYVRASYSKLYKQYYQYGYWKVYVNKKHKTITTGRQLVPMLFVLFLCGGAMASFIHPVLKLLYAVGISTYLLAACYSAFKKTNRIGFIPAVMLTFFILHVAYGLGYVMGIVDFFILNKSIKKEEQLSR